MKNKVVYAWLNAGTPFYIGIGSLRRSKSIRNRNTHCLNTRAKAERENCFEVRILHENLSWREACEIEISLIGLYGRIDNGTGILTNMTNGGEGCSNPSKEAREKISRANSRENHPLWGKSRSQETKDKISKSQTKEKHNRWGTFHSESTKDKMSKTHSVSVMTPAGLFPSSKKAHQFYNTSKATFSRWLNDQRKTDFYKIE